MQAKRFTDHLSTSCDWISDCLFYLCSQLQLQVVTSVILATFLSFTFELKQLEATQTDCFKTGWTLLNRIHHKKGSQLDRIVTKVKALNIKSLRSNREGGFPYLWEQNINYLTMFNKCSSPQKSFKIVTCAYSPTKVLESYCEETQQVCRIQTQSQCPWHNML